MKYETLAKEKDEEFKLVAFQRKWENIHAKPTHLQGEVVTINEIVLEKLEKNFATLSIEGWWVNPSLGSTIKNHLNEWLRNQK
jgi:hypothetical protein